MLRKKLSCVWESYKQNWVFKEYLTGVLGGSIFLRFLDFAAECYYD